jgi:hypothetical protein
LVALIPGAGTTDPSGLAQRFLAESVHASDLRANPLMLSLLCMLYRYEGYIPENRPRVYEECSELLFWRWDKIRHIGTPLATETKAHYLIQELAYFFFSHQSAQGGVEEYILRKVLEEYLRRHVIGEQGRARSMADDFLEYCAGRAWLLTRVGSSPRGERLFGFTHRTFMEYFAACYLVRQYPSVKLLVPILRKLIDEGASEVIPQIAIQKFDENAADGLDDCLLMLAFESISLTVKVRVPYLPFALRCLTFLRPSPLTFEKLILASFAAYGQGVWDNLLELLLGLPQVWEDQVKSCCEAVVEGRISEWYASTPLHCGCYMYLLRSSTEWSKRLTPRIEEKLAEEVSHLTDEYIEVANVLLQRSVLTLEKFVAASSVDRLISFEVTTQNRVQVIPGSLPRAVSQAIQHKRITPVSASMLIAAFGAPDSLLPLSYEDVDVLINCFDFEDDLACPWTPSSMDHQTLQALRALGITLCLAGLEIERDDELSVLVFWIDTLADEPGSFMRLFIRTLMRSRLETNRLGEAGRRHLERVGLNDSWRQFVERWARNEASVVGRRAWKPREGVTG